MRRLGVLCVCVILAAACGDTGDAGSDVTLGPASPSVASEAERTTTLTPTPSPPTTSTTEPPPVAPSYLIWGWSGVTRVEAGRSELLVAEPVAAAVDDGAGGVVFHSIGMRPGYAWLPAGADRPIPLDLDGGELTLIFAMDGRPTAIVARSFEQMSRCEPGDFVSELTIRDLTTRDERFLMCHDDGPDGGESFTSYGGGLFSWVRWVAVGAQGTDVVVGFSDLNGEEVALQHNPFAQPCSPCGLSAALSPDGTLLAYALWPVAYWQQPEPPDGDYTSAYREWHEQHAGIPTQVVVMEMATGAEVFRTDVGPNVRVDRFDGRIVTVATTTGRTLLDIVSGAEFEAPPEVSAAAGFWTDVLASLDTDTTTYDEAQRIAGEYALRYGLETGVLWSDAFVTLNPGYWAVFSGHFSARDEALAGCAAIDTACYVRYVATAHVADPELGSSMLALGGDGLGLVAFGQPEHEVRALFERLFGSAPTAPGDEAGWVAYTGWEDLGLSLGFSRPAWEHYDGEGRFVGWQVRRGTGELDLRTPSGVGIGTTTAELRAIYGSEVVIPAEPDVCGARAVQLLGEDEGVVASLDDAGIVSMLVAGLGVGC